LEFLVIYINIYCTKVRYFSTNVQYMSTFLSINSVFYFILIITPLLYYTIGTVASMYTSTSGLFIEYQLEPVNLVKLAAAPPTPTAA
jgi:hypothetical protein